MLDDEEFEVAKECSGLRMLMGVCALAFAYVVLSRGPFWQKVLILLSALPVAVLANVLRVTMTALFFHFIENESAREFLHDAAGWLTFAIAAGLSRSCCGVLAGCSLKWRWKKDLASFTVSDVRMARRTNDRPLEIMTNDE